MAIDLRLIVAVLALVVLLVVLLFGWSALIVASRTDDWMEKQAAQQRTPGESSE